jgi:hypothetical protein
MEQYQNIGLNYLCPKALSELTPCNSDWYCNGCSKVIRDFRGMTEQQVIDAMFADSKIHCGIFDAGSVVVIPQTRWKKYLSAALMALGLTTLQHAVFAQQKAHAKKKSASASAHKKQIDSVTEEAIPSIGVFYADSQPEYPGGMPKFYDYVTSHLKDIPVDDLKKAVVKFTIEQNGSMTDVQMLQRVDDVTDGKILRVLKNSIPWKPGLKDGRPFKTDYIYSLPSGLQAQN